MSDVNKQLLERWAAFGKAMQKSGSELPRHLIADTEQAIAAAERVTLCASCARADVNCPIYPQQTASCVEHRPSSQQQAEHVGDGESIDFPIAFLTTESGGGKYKLVLSFASLPDLHKGHDRILSAIKHCQQPAQQQAEPRCACGDSFTSDAMCANCLASTQAVPVARDVLMALAVEVAQRMVAVSAVASIDDWQKMVGLPAIVDRYAAQPPAVACNHRIADARNPVVSSGYVCVDCGALFSAADHNEPPAVAVPDGYALVPIEPTEGMIKEAAMYEWERGDADGITYAGLYRAMLAAAQKGGK